MSLTSIRTALWHLRAGGATQLRQWRARQRAQNAVAAPRGVAGVEAAWVGRGRRKHLSFAPVDLPALGPRRPELRVAVILDDFSALAFAYEWSIVPLDPARWHEQLDDIDLVFIESAWSGNGRLWRGKLAGPQGPAEALRDLIVAARERGIPTVFWNKEDPPHYEDFLPVARLCEVVFTSDAGRVDAYRRDLGHDRVAVLPFAAQPAIHHPVRPRRGRHARDVAFAGMYFAHRYPERRAQMDVLLGGATDASASMATGLEIFSRMLGGQTDYQFPSPLDAHVVGSLTYRQTLAAYRAYRVFLNVNSVTDSPSMCARRVFEISASGTPVVSTPSAALPHFFDDGDVPVARSREEAALVTRALVSNPELNDRTVHRAQRRIWSEHTYAHRAETVIAAALPHRHQPVRRPTISALVPTIRPGQLPHVFHAIGAQRDVRAQLVVLAHGFEADQAQVDALAREHGVEDVVLLSADRDVSLGECLNRCVAAADGEVVAKMDDDDHYGAHYLGDQVHALSYARADIVGKQAHYVHLQASDATVLRFGHREHRYTDFVMGPTIVASRDVVLAHPFPAVGLGEDTGFLRHAVDAGLTIYSADRFNFVQHRSDGGHTWQITDTDVLASGHLSFFGDPHAHTDI